MNNSRKPRILFLEHASEIGGGQDILFRFIAAVEPSFEVMVVTGGEGPFTARLKDSGIRYFVLPTKLEYGVTSRIFKLVRYAAQSVSVGFRLSKLVRKEGIDLLVPNHTYSIVSGAIASRLTGVPLVPIMHSVLDEKLLGLSEARFASVLLRLSAMGVVCTSRAVSSVLVKAGFDKNRVQHVSNWVTLPDKLAARKTGRPTITFGIFGRVVPEKGHEVFLKAGSILVKSGIDARFIIVGDTTFGKGNAADYGERLRSMASSLGLAGKTVFLPFQKSLDTQYDSVDAIVVPSIVTEAFNLIILEAMARGIPVIASDRGGNLEQIVDGESGLLFRTGDSADLALKMEIVCKQGERAIAMGLAGRKRVEERFTSEINGPLLIAAFREALSGKQALPGIGN